MTTIITRISILIFRILMFICFLCTFFEYLQVELKFVVRDEVFNISPGVTALSPTFDYRLAIQCGGFCQVVQLLIARSLGVEPTRFSDYGAGMDNKTADIEQFVGYADSYNELEMALADYDQGGNATINTNISLFNLEFQFKEVQLTNIVQDKGELKNVDTGIEVQVREGENGADIARGQALDTGVKIVTPWTLLADVCLDNEEDFEDTLVGTQARQDDLEDRDRIELDTRTYTEALDNDGYGVKPWTLLVDVCLDNEEDFTLIETQARQDDLEDSNNTELDMVHTEAPDIDGPGVKFIVPWTLLTNVCIDNEEYFGGSLVEAREHQDESDTAAYTEASDANGPRVKFAVPWTLLAEVCIYNEQFFEDALVESQEHQDQSDTAHTEVSDTDGQGMKIAMPWTLLVDICLDNEEYSEDTLVEAQELQGKSDTTAYTGASDIDGQDQFVMPWTLLTEVCLDYEELKELDKWIDDVVIEALEPSETVSNSTHLPSQLMAQDRPDVTVPWTLLEDVCLADDEHIQQDEPEELPEEMDRVLSPPMVDNSTLNNKQYMRIETPSDLAIVTLNPNSTHTTDGNTDMIPTALNHNPPLTVNITALAVYVHTADQARPSTLLISRTHLKVLCQVLFCSFVVARIISRYSPALHSWVELYQLFRHTHFKMFIAATVPFIRFNMAAYRAEIVTGGIFFVIMPVHGSILASVVLFTLATIRLSVVRAFVVDDADDWEGQEDLTLVAQEKFSPVQAKGVQVHPESDSLLMAIGQASLNLDSDKDPARPLTSTLQSLHRLCIQDTVRAEHICNDEETYATIDRRWKCVEHWAGWWDLQLEDEKFQAWAKAGPNFVRRLRMAMPEPCIINMMPVFITRFDAMGREYQEPMLVAWVYNHMNLADPIHKEAKWYNRNFRIRRRRFHVNAHPVFGTFSFTSHRLRYFFVEIKTYSHMHHLALNLCNGLTPPTYRGNIHLLQRADSPYVDPQNPPKAIPPAGFTRVVLTMKEQNEEARKYLYKPSVLDALIGRNEPWLFTHISVGTRVPTSVALVPRIWFSWRGSERVWQRGLPIVLWMPLQVPLPIS